MKKHFYAHAKKDVALLGAFLLISSLVFSPVTSAASFTFTQTQWNSAVPGSSATLPQSNWSTYDSKTSGITIPGATEVSMSLPIGSFVEDDYLLGTGQTFFSTEVNGTGNASQVQLSTVASNDPDLIVGSYDGGLSYYRNDNPLNANGWIATSIPTLNGVDVGINSKPSLVDIDNDGDLDMIVGENNRALNFFRNIGGTPIPSFVSEPIGNLGSALTGLDVGANSNPTFADIDGDLDLDLIIGQSTGRLMFVANAGSPTAPNFSSSPIDNWFSIDIGTSAHPALTDINGDNLLDLVIGNGNGDLNLYLNVGTITAPLFLQTSRVQNWLLTDFGSGVGLNPSFVDFDGDGDRDFVLGMENGTPSQTRWYVRGPNTGAPNYGYSSVILFIKSMIKFDGTNLRDIGPAFGDLDHDTFYTSSGAYTSGILYVGQQSTFTTASYVTGGTGTISLEIRAGDSFDGTGTTWSAWTPIPTGGGSISTITSSTPRQYVQYRATLSTSDTSVTPTLESVTVNYKYINTQTLTSSKFDTGITDVRLTQLMWNQSLPAGTTVSVSLQSASTLAGLTSALWYDFSTPSTISSGSALGDGIGDRFFQYKISLTSDGNFVPTVNDISVVYAQNTAPQFDATFGGGAGVTAVQNASDGTVNIQYRVRDVDNISVTPSFEYSVNGGAAWSAIPALYLGASDLSPKTVSGTYQTFSALWNAKGNIPNVFSANTKIRVTVNDGEAYNNITSATSGTFTVDTKNPVITNFTLDSSVDKLTIVATDDATPKMRLSNTGSFSGSPINISSPYDWTPSASETVYIEVSDAYGNIVTTNAKAPTMLTGVTITDVSQPASSIWSERINWDVYIPTSGTAFGSYQLHRSTDGTNFSSLGVSITNINTTSYTNSGLNSGTVYYYKVVVVDANGDTSNYSSTVYDQPDGGTKVEFTNSSVNGAEGNSGSTVITVPVRLSGVSSAPVTVSYQIDSIDAGTATAGNDYAFTPGSLTFPAGSAASQSFTFSVTGDIGYEPNETIRISLVDPTGAVIGTNGTYTHTITNDDALPVVSFTSATSNATEGASAIATVTLSTISNTNTVIPFTIGGSATSISDYSLLQTSPITIPSGSTSATITIQTLTDSIYEGNETVVLTLGTPTGATLGAPATHTLTIQDVNTQPTITINDATVVEGSSGTIPAPFTITLSGTSASTVTVAYATQDGSASAPNDYASASSTLAFFPLETTKNISILVNGDTLFEPNETFTVVLSNPTGATLGAKSFGIGTIQNDDILPVAQFSSASSRGQESATSVLIPVTLSAPAAQAVSIDYAVTGGSANSGTDFTLPDGTLSIPVGASSASIPLTVINDTIFEPDETVIITLSNPANATLGSPTSHTYTIQNDDLDIALISFNTSASSVSEGTPSASLPVQLSRALSQISTINYAVTGGTATSSDFTLTAGTLTFVAGATTGAIPVSIINDSIYETDETVIVTLSAPSSNLNLISPSVHTLTIQDNDPLPSIVINDVQGMEGDSGTKLFTFTVTLSGASADNTTIAYATTDGTAVTPSDYSATSGILTFASGITTQTISVLVNGDTINESDETFSVVLSSPVGATLGVPFSGTGTIQNDDTPPVVSFVTSSAGGNESVAAISIPISLSAPASQTVTIPYSVTAVSAVQGSDYTIISGPATIPIGATATTITLTIINDTVNEPDETVVITLGTPTNATLGSPSSYTYTILNDDIETATISFATSSSSWQESVPTITIPVVLSGVISQPVAVDYTVSGGSAIAGNDYTLAAGTLMFPAGSASGTISIALIDDLVHELDETVQITLSNPTPSANVTLGIPMTHVFTILDNDPLPTLSITDISVPEGNAGSVSGQFDVTLSAPTSQSVTVAYATQNGSAVFPDDYASASGTLTFAPGQTTLPVIISIFGDAAYEGNENFTIRLSDAANATISIGTGIATILDDDTPPQIQFATSSASGLESVANITIPLTLSTPPSQAATLNYTVSGSAISGTDHSLSSGSIPISSGALSAAITFTVTDDATVEGNETVVITLSTLSGGVIGSIDSLTYTILDDDSIIQGGVTIDQIGATTARVSWTTTQPSTGAVEYALDGVVYQFIKSDSNFVTAHNIYLSDLSKDTLYYVRVKSTDNVGQESVDDNSGAGYTFTTNDGPIISTVNVASSSDVAAIITWDTDKPASALVTYATSSSLVGGIEVGNVAVEGAGAPPIAHSVTLINLKSLTTYYFKVKSVDTDGNISEDVKDGSYYSFTTTPDATPPVISGITTPVVAGNLVVVFWQTNELADSQVEYGVSSGSYPNQTTRNATLSTNQSATLLNLLPEQRYYYRVISRDSRGNTAYSAEQTVDTPELGNAAVNQVTQQLTVALSQYNQLRAMFDALQDELNSSRVEKDETPPVISDVAVRDVGAFTATISWNTDEPATSFVEYGETTKYNLNAGLSQFTDTHEIKLSRLKMGIKYHFRVLSQDAVSNLATSSDATFETIFSAEALEDAIEVGDVAQFQENIGELIESVTPSVAPPVISDVKVSLITERGATVTWRTNVDATSLVALAVDRNYDVKSEAPYKTEFGSSESRVRAHQVTLTNLEPGTLYHIQVRSSNVVDVTGKSADVTFTTVFEKPSIEVLELQERQFTVGWTTVKPTTSYVEITDGTTGKTTRVGDEAKIRSHQVIVRNLTPGTDYNVRAFGLDDAGNIIESAVKKVHTPLDSDIPVISNIKIENALVPGRNDRLQTIISWTTNEPSTSQVYYEEGIGTSETLANKTLFQEPPVTNHLVVVGVFRPGQVYRMQIVSADAERNTAFSQIQSFLTPQQAESIFDIITKNFQQSFGWLKF